MSRTYVESACAALRSSGRRITPTQMVVIKILAEADGPMITSEIFHRIEELNQYVPRTCVYRLLDNMLEAGAVVRIGATGGYFRREDCMGKGSFPLFFVDVFHKKTSRLPLENQDALDRDLRALVKRHNLPEADYHLELVAGLSLLAGSAS